MAQYGLLTGSPSLRDYKNKDLALDATFQDSLDAELESECLFFFNLKILGFAILYSCPYHYGCQAMAYDR